MTVIGLRVSLQILLDWFLWDIKSLVLRQVNEPTGKAEDTSVHWGLTLSTYLDPLITLMNLKGHNG